MYFTKIHLVFFYRLKLAFNEAAAVPTHGTWCPTTISDILLSGRGNRPKFMRKVVQVIRKQQTERNKTKQNETKVKSNANKSNKLQTQLNQETTKKENRKQKIT